MVYGDHRIGGRASVLFSRVWRGVRRCRLLLVPRTQVSRSKYAASNIYSRQVEIFKFCLKIYICFGFCQKCLILHLFRTQSAQLVAFESVNRRLSTTPGSGYQ